MKSLRQLIGILLRSIIYSITLFIWGWCWSANAQTTYVEAHLDLAEAAIGLLGASVEFPINGVLSIEPRIRAIRYSGSGFLGGRSKATGFVVGTEVKCFWKSEWNHTKFYVSFGAQYVKERHRFKFVNLPINIDELDVRSGVAGKLFFGYKWVNRSSFLIETGVGVRVADIGKYPYQTLIPYVGSPMLTGAIPIIRLSIGYRFRRRTAGE